MLNTAHAATFGWLCVETTALTAYSKMCQQPPSGGCVLKLLNHRKQVKSDGAATFGWLCVETAIHCMLACSRSAATFGWLCVETGANIEHKFQEQAATFGWLCVETI